MNKKDNLFINNDFTDNNLKENFIQNISNENPEKKQLNKIKKSSEKQKITNKELINKLNDSFKSIKGNSDNFCRIPIMNSNVRFLFKDFDFENIKVKNKNDATILKTEYPVLKVEKFSADEKNWKDNQINNLNQLTKTTNNIFYTPNKKIKSFSLNKNLKSNIQFKLNLEIKKINC